MGSVLYVIGLGPAGLDQLTLGSYRRLKGAKRVFVRTLKHPCVQELAAEGINIESFDVIYDREESFEKVYAQIVKRLRDELERSSEVVYAVPGHPLVAERSVQLIQQELSEHFTVRIHPAVSFLDEIFRAVGFDPIEGIRVCNYDGIREAGLTGKEWVIIPQVYSKIIASEVKLDLMEIYPDDSPVHLVHNLGTDKEHTHKTVLFELDHYPVDHLTTVVIPPTDNIPSLTALASIMKTLRSPNGCPWDREQTHDSLKPYLIEESYEVLDAIERHDMYNLCEELGDLLLQIVFHAQVANENGDFTLYDVVQGIIQKMIRRHPHVFGEAKAETAGDVMKTWDEIKKAEKECKGDKEEEAFFPDSKALPALMLATQTQRKAAKVGFDWPDLEGPLAKVREELKELEEAIALDQGVAEELGDVLFAVVNLSRFLELDAEQVLRETVTKFRDRFNKMVQLAGKDGLNFNDLSLEEMDVYWEKAKNEENRDIK